MAKNVSHPLGVCFAENPQDDLDLSENARCEVAHSARSLTPADGDSRMRLMGKLEAERLAGGAPQSAWKPYKSKCGEAATKARL